MSGRTTIKANFESGDTPTEAQFADWIDSDFNLDDDDSDDISEGSSNLFLTAIAQVITGIKTFTNGLIYNARTKSGVTALSYGLTVSVDFSVRDIFRIASVTGNMTINGSNIEDGQTGVIKYTMDVTGGYTLALGTGTWVALGGSDIATSNIASTTYFITFFVDESNIYYNIIST